MSDEPSGSAARSVRGSRRAPRRSTVLLCVLAGVIGLGCCIYPVVLVLLGAASASAAVGLGNFLYGSWGWVFKLAALGFATTAFVIQRRRLQRCGLPSDARSSAKRAAAWLGGSALATYLVLYVLTKSLGSLAG